MAKIFLICGFLGAGKTTISKQLAQQYDAEYMNVDETVAQMFAPEQYHNDWERCFSEAEKVLWLKIQEYAKCDKSVVFDVGFWTRESRDEARLRAQQIGLEPVLYYVYAPDNILKQRISKRTGKIATNNIKNFDNIKQMFEAPQSDEKFIRVDNF